ncbi:glycerol-3-phosphate 1-O-acyltransferase PlsY [Cytophagaceae bacterium DM2B3-1]|uniref:Glycerol-3-phosphate acyltransferase n=1 Tax=Xanthocytophaga flava TaxID=3048013 RepID=A0AAE3QQI0_9BACT|nr:glycerol-3-phosphate 1-O-acyltransferase PlsY [Xanthocytophaga flavus]MDJ1470099.1 glycerol-3-phosphate 1-O-acyltransferase PlsY [Xanthocytophaga flavus]MDJ1481360.1 glycerol-3-phosphate 1-O-acyltransferase PlsY [Xanthocytophaga flavus]MDJ1491338.1 glycerol-3-phosphate 1-O-acyltransferase PlsY [Xanthocytophaga flavus]
MEITLIIAGFIASYLIGSLPTALWYGQAFHGIDIRNYGSGNSGATNTFRVLGKKAGSIVMAVDVFKGWTATSIAAILLHLHAFTEPNLITYQLFIGILAVVGHIFPIYANFRGGKGVATLLGMVLAIHVEAALLCIAIFFLVVLLSKYVSLGSMIAALAFPLLMFMPRFSPDDPILIIFGFAMFAIVVLTHQKNIIRLIHGEESRTNIRFRKK